MSDWIRFRFLPALSWGLMHCLCFTFRTMIIGSNHLIQLQKTGNRIIFVFWHGRQFMFIPYLSKTHTAALASPSRDGRMNARLLENLGYEIIFGSSEKSPVKAVIGCIAKIRKGYNLLVTPDGPRGPAQNVKPGALYIAKKTHSMILPLSFSARPVIVMKSWDRYLLPLPFAKIVIGIGEPFRPSFSLEESDIEKECQFLKDRLNQITLRVDSILH
jgi:lysophospholipid acyltransferase (LPLAT)-like uncharacterized protein